MDIVKLYKANWKKNVFVTSTSKNEEKIFTYYLCYRRPNHIGNPNLNTNSSNNHSDAIDNEIVNKLDQFFNNGVKHFESTLAEFKPWNDFTEIEKARISKTAYGHDCADVVINSNDFHAVSSLKARINCLNYSDVNNSMNNLFPTVLNLNINGRIESLISEKFMDRTLADETVIRYFGE